MDIYDKYKATLKNPTGFSREPIEGIEYMSYSRLKELNRSAGHYKLRYIDKHKLEPTPAMAFGRLMHTALLEPKLFKKTFTVRPAKSDYPKLLDTTTELKAALKECGIKVDSKWKKSDLIKNLTRAAPKMRDIVWDCINEDYEKSLPKNSLIVTSDEADLLIGMIKAIENHSKAVRLVTGGNSEVNAYYKDEELGVTWFCRLDYLKRQPNPAGGDPLGDVFWITELKTTKDASPWNFPREMDNFSYHLQNWIYNRVIQGITKLKTNLVQFAIEKERPYGIGLYTPDSRVTDTAGWQIRKLLEMLKNCKLQNRWPVYEERIIPLGLPAYSYWRIEESADREEMG